MNYAEISKTWKTSIVSPDFRFPENNPYKFTDPSGHLGIAFCTFLYMASHFSGAYGGYIIAAAAIAATAYLITGYLAGQATGTGFNPTFSGLGQAIGMGILGLIPGVGYLYLAQSLAQLYEMSRQGYGEMALGLILIGLIGSYVSKQLVDFASVLGSGANSGSSTSRVPLPADSRPGDHLSDGSVVVMDGEGNLYGVKIGDFIVYSGPGRTTFLGKEFDLTENGHVAVIGEIPEGATKASELLVYEFTWDTFKSNYGFPATPSQTTYGSNILDIRRPSNFNGPITLPSTMKQWYKSALAVISGGPENSPIYGPWGGGRLLPGFNCSEYAKSLYNQSGVRTPMLWEIGVGPADFLRWGTSTRIK